MNFNYSLQKILDLKSNEKTQAEWLLSQAISELSNEENDLRRLHIEIDATRQTLLKSAQNSSTISNILHIQSYLDYLDLMIVNKIKEIVKSKNNVELKQENLTTKMLDEKVWSKAKERAYQKFTSLELKKDQNNLDEMASMRHPVVKN